MPPVFLHAFTYCIVEWQVCQQSLMAHISGHFGTPVLMLTVCQRALVCTVKDSLTLGAAMKHRNRLLKRCVGGVGEQPVLKQGVKH